VADTPGGPVDGAAALGRVRAVTRRLAAVHTRLAGELEQRAAAAARLRAVELQGQYVGG
jgi:hypothetical protein